MYLYGAPESRDECTMTILHGKNIFVLEDEFILAWEAEEILREAGATVVGPAHNIAAAIALLGGQDRIDAAVLDININGCPSTQVADELKQRGVPFVYATGYGRDSEKVLNAPVLSKPYSPAQLVDSIRSLLAFD